jgi:GTPase SAR1 family protein
MILGDISVGKTSLKKAITHGVDSFIDSIEELDSPMLGRKHNFKNFTSSSYANGLHLKANFWDRLGKKYLLASREDFNKKEGVLLCFDLTNKNSF